MKYSASAILFLSLLFAVGAFRVPAAHASFFSDISHFFFPDSSYAPNADVQTSEEMPILQAPLSGSSSRVLGTSTHSVSAAIQSLNDEVQTDSAVSSLPTTTPSSVYVVVSGDTLFAISQKYGITVAALKTANVLTKNALSIGQKLTIPSVAVPVTQVKDSVSYSSQAVSLPPAPASKSTVSTATTAIVEVSPDGYFIRPIKGGKNTQGIHGHNAVDLADVCGTPIYASAAGTTTIADASGWNGGYGNYVEIDHPNGSQTLYAHMQTVIVKVGQALAQGQQIGTIGNTGDVDKEGGTGCHVHFEIHNNGYANPFLE